MHYIVEKDRDTLHTVYQYNSTSVVIYIKFIIYTYNLSIEYSTSFSLTIKKSMDFIFP